MRIDFDDDRQSVRLSAHRTPLTICPVGRNLVTVFMTRSGDLQTLTTQACRSVRGFQHITRNENLTVYDAENVGSTIPVTQLGCSLRGVPVSMGFDASTHSISILAEKAGLVIELGSGRDIHITTTEP